MPKLDVIFDKEFGAVNRKWTPTEARNFDRSARLAGEIIDSLKVVMLDGHTILIDGYNRAAWFNALPEDTEIKRPRLQIVKGFSSREDIVEWIRLYQLGRRNLTDTEYRYQLGQLAKEAKGKNPKTEQQVIDIDLAKNHDISQRTVQRSRALTEALDRIAEVDEDFANELRSEEIPLADPEILGISKCDDMLTAIANVRSGKRWGYTEPPNEPDVDEPEPENPHIKRIRGIKKAFKTLMVTVLPDTHEKMLDIATMIHPKGTPQRGGFPVAQVNECMGVLQNIFQSWAPSAVCSNCEGSGCSTCQAKGFER